MSKHTLDSTLTEREAKRLMSRGIPIICRVCGKLIQIDEKFIRKLKGGRATPIVSNSNYYHKTCWRKLFH